MDEGTKGLVNMDVLLQAHVGRADINLLVRLVEGLGHLGVITTLDREQGLIRIQTTEDCREELLGLMRYMPVAWRPGDGMEWSEEIP